MIPTPVIQTILLDNMPTDIGSFCNEAGIPERRLLGIRKGESRFTSIAIVDRILVTLGLQYLWHTELAYLVPDSLEGV